MEDLADGRRRRQLPIQCKSNLHFHFGPFDRLFRLVQCVSFGAGRADTLSLSFAFPMPLIAAYGHTLTHRNYFPAGKHETPLNVPFRVSLLQAQFSLGNRNCNHLKFRYCSVGMPLNGIRFYWECVLNCEIAPVACRTKGEREKERAYLHLPTRALSISPEKSNCCLELVRSFAGCKFV